MKKGLAMKIVLPLLILIVLSSGCSKELGFLKTYFPDPSDSSAIPPPATTGICDYDLNESSLHSQGYSKIFEENFSGDLSNWNVWNSGAYNNELECYLPANLALTNGMLVITAKRQTVNGFENPYSQQEQTFNFTSGRLESKAGFSASNSAKKVRITARIKIAGGYGMWPAFWSYGQDWPTNGEIDILETTGETRQFTTNYFYGDVAGTVQTDNSVTLGTVHSDADLTTCFHVYELIWEENSLTYLLDGKVVNTKTATSSGGSYIPKIFGKTENIALNLAVGGDNFGTPFDPSKIQGANMYVDWVKVFTANN